MTKSLSDVAALLAVAQTAARATADLLRNAHAADIRGKSNARDLVTEWDLRSEQLLREILGETGHPILGEEGGHGGAVTVSHGDLRWVVDPIDGTVNFAHGLPIWCVSIALEEVGKGAVLGVVTAPVLGWWFEATRGGGARDGRGAPLHVSECTRLDQALLATGFPYDIATHPQNNLAEWEHMQKRASACRRLGSAALDLCLVASGSFDGYWERKLSPWDIAAATLIVSEAGGTVTDTRGGPFDMHAGEAVASNGAIHDELVSELGRVRK